MESEKVKEIKTVLERCKTQTQNDCRNCPYGENPKCLDLLIGNCLNYINELESDIERLKQHKRELEGGQRDLLKVIKEFDKENQQLKDRIAELEEGRTQQCIDCIEWRGANEKLKQFAERLKEKVHDRDYVEGYAYLGICEEIDETLKEFLI